MTCNRCGIEVSPDDKFCGECGADLSIVTPPPVPPPAPVMPATGCPHCGAHLIEGAVFCGNCGQKISAAPMPSSRPAVPPSPPVLGSAKPAKSGKGLVHQIVALLAVFVLSCGLIRSTYVWKLMDWHLSYTLTSLGIGMGVGLFLRLRKVKPFKRAWVSFALFLGVALLGVITADISFFILEEPESVTNFFRYYFMPDVFVALGVGSLVTGISHLSTGRA